MHACILYVAMATVTGLSAAGNYGTPSASKFKITAIFNTDIDSIVDTSIFNAIIGEFLNEFRFFYRTSIFKSIR